MPVDLEKIEQGLGDIQKNMATKKEVIELIESEVAKEKEEQKAKLKEIEDNAKTAVQDLQKNIDALNAGIKTLKSTRFAALKDSGGSYNGVWNGMEQAKNFGLFILASVMGNEAAKKQLEDSGIELKRITSEKAMAEGNQAGGGIVVPTEFIPNLIVLQEKYGSYRRNTTVYPMASDSGIAPKLSSGLLVYCPGEGNAITPSDLTLTSVGLTAKMWCTLTAISAQLDEDSAIPLGELVGRQIAQAFAKKEDEIGFLGDGTANYFGHTGITGALLAVDAAIANIKSLVVGAGNAYSELTLANFEELVGTLPNYADDGDAKWYNSRKFYYTVMVKLALDAGSANATEIIQGRGVKEKTFLSFPVEFSQAMPKAEANSQICTILGNLRMGSYLGDRRMLTIDRSTEVYFANVQIGIRGTQRVAVTVHGVGDTTDAGPICGLITAAA